MINIIDGVSELDLEALYRIESCIINGWTKEMLSNAFKNESSFFFKAEMAGEIVGYINYSIILDEAEINSIAVLEGYRKIGIGNALLDHLIKYLSTKGIKAIYLEVNENNISAVKLYEKCGFEFISKRKNYYKEETALICKRSLE